MMKNKQRLTFPSSSSLIFVWLGDKKEQSPMAYIGEKKIRHKSKEYRGKKIITKKKQTSISLKHNSPDIPSAEACRTG